MAGIPFKPLTKSALAWAVGRALRFSIGTCVVALLLATTLSGDAAERFATVGYLAAIFTAIALIATRFLPPADERSGPDRPPFPLFLGYSGGIVFFLAVIAMLVSDPGAEAFALTAAVLLVFFAVLVRCGKVSAFAAALARGGFLAAVTRYAAVLGAAVLALAALIGDAQLETLGTLGYRLMAVATCAVAVSLLAPTKVGIRVQSGWIAFVATLDKLAHAFVFERAAAYGAIVSVAAMLPASLLPQPYSEPFAVAAYVAAVAAAIGVSLECRRLRS